MAGASSRDAAAVTAVVAVVAVDAAAVVVKKA